MYIFPYTQMYNVCERANCLCLFFHVPMMCVVYHNTKIVCLQCEVIFIVNEQSMITPGRNTIQTLNLVFYIDLKLQFRNLSLEVVTDYFDNNSESLNRNVNRLTEITY